MVGRDARPTDTDYNFDKLERLEELRGVITSYWIGENGGEDGKDMLMSVKQQEYVGVTLRCLTK